MTAFCIYRMVHRALTHLDPAGDIIAAVDGEEGSFIVTLRWRLVWRQLRLAKSFALPPLEQIRAAAQDIVDIAVGRAVRELACETQQHLYN